MPLGHIPKDDASLTQPKERILPSAPGLQQTNTRRFPPFPRAPSACLSEAALAKTEMTHTNPLLTALKNPVPWAGVSIEVHWGGEIINHNQVFPGVGGK